MPIQPERPPSRRFFLRYSSYLAIATATGALLPRGALAARPDARSLALRHTHTGEHLELVYAVGNDYVPQAMQALNHFLRDHYSGEVGQIEPGLLDLLHGLRQTLGTDAPLHVISGYRCPKTNDRLRNTRGGGVAKRSLHMEGKAIDIRIPGIAINDLRDAAMSLHAGGVGTYTHDQFVHLDTGRPRSW